MPSTNGLDVGIKGGRGLQFHCPRHSFVVPDRVFGLEGRMWGVGSVIYTQIDAFTLNSQI